MAKLINHDEAIAFWESIKDPIVQALLQHAHSLIFTEGSAYFKKDFDLLLFYKVLEALFRDREMLARALSGEVTESPWVAD